MTPEQKAAYLKHSERCPFCGSWNIGGGMVDINIDGAQQHVICHACNKLWTDIYSLVDVEEAE
jgi:transposase-like protein